MPPSVPSLHRIHASSKMSLDDDESVSQMTETGSYMEASPDPSDSSDSSEEAGCKP